MTFYEKIREADEEGAVLLKNADTLPFTKNDNIAIFGRPQIDYYKSGTGSGGSVHIPYSVNLIEGFENLCASDENAPKINSELLSVYKEWIKENPFDNGGGGWAAEPWCQKDMPLSHKLVASTLKSSNKAIFIVGRTAGEDQDNAAKEGSYLLTQTEYENLKAICFHYEKVTLLLNVSNIVDISWINEPEFLGHITAVMFVWQGGMEGGNATANLLCGKKTPSGKLTDTIAWNIADYPSTKNFGNKEQNVYEEDIYVGYRYFSTFAEDKVQYPFGFGLSYTTFSVEKESYSFDGETGCVTVKVSNTGNFEGKETVQLYLEAPQGKLGKAKRELVAFKKTSLLAPGKSETVELKFNLKQIASYDDSGITGYPFTFLLEEGEYKAYLGTDVKSASLICLENGNNIVLEKTLPVKQLEQAGAPILPFKRLGKDGVYEDVPLTKVNLEERIKNNLPKEIEYTGRKGISFQDVKADPSKMDAFIAQLNVKELATIVRGEGMMSLKVTPGIASAFGGMSQTLHDLGVPAAGCSDGPSGIRLDTGKEATLIPMGTLLASTWNPELVEELYTFLGKELLSYKIDYLLGPGINIHRSPLNGRNFEYFSEDPYLTGVFGCACVKGIQKEGAIATVKHFCCNNQEYSRRYVDAAVSERALREIYLKPFEMTVKDANVRAIMTAYNPVNGHLSASNYDITNYILHKEWGYTGIVMTDWWATMNDCVSMENNSAKNLSSMLRARNDVYMIVINDSAETGGHGDDIESAIEAGKLTVAELQLCAKDLLLGLTEAPCSNRELGPLKNEIHFESKIKEAPANARVIGMMEEFNPETSDVDTYLYVDEEEIYNFNGTYIKNGGDTLSQSITNILIDGENGASFECRSTDDKYVTVNAAQIRLNVGYYKIDLAHTKPGISVKSLFITKGTFSPL